MIDNHKISHPNKFLHKHNMFQKSLIRRYYELYFYKS